MFYLAYLRSELLRRWARTTFTVLGLAVGVGLVITVSALSRGLDRAQTTALDPLASIGTDLTVTRESPEAEGPEGFGDRAGLIEANRSIVTDLSKLGKPGEQFVHDFFLPGADPTFAEEEAGELTSVPGVATVAAGLTVLAVHQEGTVPEIVAEFETGGEELEIDREIEPLTAAEVAEVQACVERSGGRQGDFGALRECLPERLRRFRGTVTTPRETLRQVLDPPQTDITSEPYTIAGVDAGQPGIGLVTPAQLTAGRFLSRSAGREALVATTHASRNDLKVGSVLELNGAEFRVVGLVQPPLGGQAADVYLPLGQLQKLAGREGQANVALVRAQSSADVGAVQAEIERTFEGAQIAGAGEVADRISGSLVDAADLSRRLGLSLSAAAAAAAFLLAGLLTLASVGKRVREIGTLKALGWKQRQVVRQVLGESLAQGVAGGLLGVGLGVAASAAVGAFGPTLSASSTADVPSFFGLGEIAARTVTSEIALTAPVESAVLAVGFGLALAGGLVAGAVGALRTARMRPADALRQVE